MIDVFLVNWFVFGTKKESGVVRIVVGVAVPHLVHVDLLLHDGVERVVVRHLAHLVPRRRLEMGLGTDRPLSGSLSPRRLVTAARANARRSGPVARRRRRAHGHVRRGTHAGSLVARVLASACLRLSSRWRLLSRRRLRGSLKAASLAQLLSSSSSSLSSSSQHQQTATEATNTQ